MNHMLYAHIQRKTRIHLLPTHYIPSTCYRHLIYKLHLVSHMTGLFFIVEETKVHSGELTLTETLKPWSKGCLLRLSYHSPFCIPTSLTLHYPQIPSCFLFFSFCTNCCPLPRAYPSFPSFQPFPHCSSRLQRHHFSGFPSSTPSLIPLGGL